MKILHISNKPVFPLVDGGCFAMAANFRALTELTDNVDHIYLHTLKHRVNRELYPEGTQFPLDDASTFVDTSVTFLGAFLGILKGKNYNISRFFSQQLNDKLKAYLIQNKPQVVVLESLFLVPYLEVIRKNSTAKIVLRAHNVEYQLWEQQACKGNFLKKRYLKHLAKTLKKEEIKGLNSVDLIWTITEEDRLTLKEIGVTTKSVYVPVAMKAKSALPDYERSDFFHLGSLNWNPNKLTVERLNKLWKQFSLHHHNQLHIAGSFPGDLKLQPVDGVQLHGFIEDVKTFMCSHGTLVTPVVSGSGVRVKLLEAMSLGVPCISTSLGAAGILNSGQVLCIADSDEEWLKALTEFAVSAEIRRLYGEKGKAYIEKYHSFASVKALITASLES